MATTDREGPLDTHLGPDLRVFERALAMLGIATDEASSPVTEAIANQNRDEHARPNQLPSPSCNS